MFTREQFLTWRFKHPEKPDWSYEQYLHWAYQQQTKKRNKQLILTALIITYIIGLISGLALS